MTTCNRTGENGNAPSRSNRLFQQESYWYYRTREGVAIGPFDSRDEAEVGVNDFVDFMSHAGQEMSQTLSMYGQAA